MKFHPRDLGFTWGMHSCKYAKEQIVPFSIAQETKAKKKE
jgi:hypothetical protein